MTFTLSDQQQRIVDYRGGHLQVIACAGSGKTESVSRRVAALINEGAEPQSIVAFTFTEKAATELKDRIYKRVEEVKGEEFLGRLGPMFVGTIHAYCFRVLQDHVPKYGNYDVLDEHRHTAMVSRRRYEIDLSKLHTQHWRSIGIFLRAADAIGNELISLDDLQGTEIGECYEAYLDILDRYRLLTFGMIIAKAVEVLQQDHAIRERVTSSLRHLIVDEYQDINPAQEKLIEILTQPQVQLCVVGDDDQAIYQWRGSDVRNILKFEHRYSGVETVMLEENRRSRPLIIDAANSFAQSIPDRLPKKMLPTRPVGPNEVIPWQSEDPQSEAETIARHIQSLHEQGWRYQDIAVLFRSVRTAAPPLVAALQDRGIPFNCGGRTGLFAHPEINHFGELFAWMAGFSWKDERFGPGRDACLDNVVKGLVHSFRLQPDAIDELKSYFEDWKAWQGRGNRRVNLIADFYKHLRVLGLDEIDPNTPEGSARLGAFARFSKILADYEHVTMRSRWVINADGVREYKSGTDRGKNFWTGLANFLVHYAKDSYEDFEGEEIHTLDAVSILTVHQAKGLEWPILFLPGLSSLRFPSSMSGRKQEWCISEDIFTEENRSRYEGGDADERRLFYVAMTRARDILYTSCFRRINQMARISPYLAELSDSIDCSEIPILEDLPLPDAPDILKSPESPPLELGFSDLAKFDDCGYSYRLNRVFGFEPELAAELGYGNAVHHVLRHVAEDARETGVIPESEQLAEIISRELFVPYATLPTFNNMTKSISRLVHRYVDDFETDLKRIWATERPFEIHFQGGILSGRADVILDEEDGKVDHLAIVDYKTTAEAHFKPRYEQQLRIYAAAGQQEGLNVDACYMHELKNSFRESVTIDGPTLEESVEWAAQKVAEIATGDFTEKPEQSVCERCDMKFVCRYDCVRDE